MNAESIQKLALETKCFALFDYINDIIFFMKNCDGVFIEVNNGFLKTLGFSKKEDVIGKTDYELFKTDVADIYKSSDKLLLDGALSVYHQEEIIQKNSCITKFLTTKFPIKNEQGDVDAIIGITRDVVHVKESNQYRSQLQKALDYIDIHCAEDIKITELSSMSNMSDSTFLRTFKRDFNMTPKRYIISRRLKKVTKMIRETNLPFCDISIQCGFSDQSHMTREFRRVKGITPSQFLNQLKQETKQIA